MFLHYTVTFAGIKVTDCFNFLSWQPKALCQTSHLNADTRFRELIKPDKMHITKVRWKTVPLFLAGFLEV